MKQTTVDVWKMIAFKWNRTRFQHITINHHNHIWIFKCEHTTQQYRHFLQIAFIGPRNGIELANQKKKRRTQINHKLNDRSTLSHTGYLSTNFVGDAVGNRSLDFRLCAHHANKTTDFSQQRPPIDTYCSMRTFQNVLTDISQSAYWWFHVITWLDITEMGEKESERERERNEKKCGNIVKHPRMMELQNVRWVCGAHLWIVRQNDPHSQCLVSCQVVWCAYQISVHISR